MVLSSYRPDAISTHVNEALLIILMGSILLLCLTFAASSSSAELNITWEEGQRVTTDDNKWYVDMTAEDDEVHVIYNDDLRTGDLLYRWFDGESWQQPFKFTAGNSRDSCVHPAIAVDDGQVHIAWVDSRDGDMDIFYRWYDGEQWWPEQEISSDVATENQTYPDIAVDGGQVHVVYMDNVDADWDVYYVHFDGSSWSAEREISIDVGHEPQYEPRLALDGDLVHVVWLNGETYSRDVFYTYFNGTHWSAPRRVNVADQESYQGNPSVAADKGVVHFAWDGYLMDRWWIFHRSFDLKGWSEATRIGPDSAYLRGRDPSISVNGNFVYIGFEYQGYSTTYLTAHDGEDWSEAVRLSFPGNYQGGDDPIIDAEGGYIHVTYMDSRDNVCYHRAIVDRAPPTTVMYPLTPYWRTEGNIIVQWNASDDYGLDAVLLMYRFDPGTGDYTDWEVWSRQEVQPLTVAWGTFEFPPHLGDGFYEMYTMAIDLADKVEDVDPGTITVPSIAYDTTPPTGNFTFLHSGQWLTTTSVSVSIEAEDWMSSCASVIPGAVPPVYVRVTSDGSWEDKEWLQLPDHPEVTLSLPPGDGVRTVSLQIRDLAGLISGTISRSVSVDTTPPTGSVTINDGDEYTSSRDVHLTLAFDDMSSGVSAMRIGTDGTWDGEVWVDPVVAQEWKGMPLEGTIAIYFQVRDVAGLTSETYVDTIALDEGAPTCTISINEGAERTNSGNVRLTFSYSDDVSGVRKLRIWDDEAFDDEPELDPSGTLQWTYTGEDGAFSVKCQVVDAVGWTSAVTADTILLDTERPSLETIYPTSGERGVNLTQRILVVFSEPVDQASAERAFSMTDSLILVEGSFEWSWEGQRMEFVPVGRLEPLTDYSIIVDSSIVDLSGNKLVMGEILTFRTRSADDDGEPDGAGSVWPWVLLVVLVLATVVVILLVQRRRLAPPEPYAGGEW